jgi:uncharacterized protein
VKGADPGPLHVTENLIRLERGDAELLLVNSFFMRPLYVARGRESVQALLDDARGRTLAELEAAHPADARLIEMLREHRLLLGPDERERYAGAEIDAHAVEPERPRDKMTVFLLLTESCNLGCVYCLNGSGTYQKTAASEMSADVAMSSIRTCLGKLKEGGTLEVTFFGGEPLLRWALIKEIIRRCETELRPEFPDRRIAFHLTSNLTIQPPDLVEVLKKHKVTVLSDIDGPPEVHDRCRPFLGGRASHARSAATIKLLVDAGIRVALRTTLTALNEDAILETAAHHKALGAVNCGFVPVCPVNSDRQYLADDLLPDPDKITADLIRLYRGGTWTRDTLFPFNEYVLKLRPGSRQVTGCAAPSGSTPVIRPNGDVYLCIYLVGQQEFRYGTTPGPWERRLLDESSVSLHVDNVQECKGCAWRYVCGGGCPVMKLAHLSGVPANPRAQEYGRRINCDFTKAVLTELLWDTAGKLKEKLGSFRSGAEAAAPVDRPSFC